MSGQLRQRLHFWAAVAVLGVSAVGMQLAKGGGWLRVIKKPLPIRKPLIDMNRDCLRPLQFVVSQRLAPEMEVELGTTEYINWILDLPEEDKPWRGQVALSATYYTGKQDQVPHVPEECFNQGDFSLAGDSEIRMEMPRLGETVSVRRLSFLPPRGVGTRVYVYYVICVNGRFFSDRNAVRVKMADPRDYHLFYSKVEASFQGVVEERLSELDECARDLLDAALTELRRSHWPVKGWERGGPPARAE